MLRPQENAEKISVRPCCIPLAGARLCANEPVPCKVEFSPVRRARRLASCRVGSWEMWEMMVGDGNGWIGLDCVCVSVRAVLLLGCGARTCHWDMLLNLPLRTLGSYSDRLEAVLSYLHATSPIHS